MPDLKSGLRSEIKDLLLQELRSKGYAPNPADVNGAVDKVLEVIEREITGSTEAVPVPGPVPVPGVVPGVVPVTTPPPITLPAK